MEDLALLARSFLTKFCPHQVTLSAEAIELLQQHSGQEMSESFATSSNAPVSCWGMKGKSARTTSSCNGPAVLASAPAVWVAIPRVRSAGLRRSRAFPVRLLRPKELSGFLSFHGAREQVPLPKIAPQSAQALELLVCFNPFSNDLQIGLVRQRDDQLHRVARAAIGQQFAH